MLQGYKTYLTAAAIAVFAGLGLWLGKLDWQTSVQLFLAAAGLAGLRSGVSSTVLNAVTAIHALNAPSVSMAGAKQAAGAAIDAAKKVAPVFALCLGLALVAPLLVACGTTSTPGTTLAASETLADAAQTWWITNCINAKAFSFCSDPATVATVKAASQTATDAAQTATDAVTAKTLDAATIAQLVADATADAAAIDAIIARLKTQK